MSAVTAANTIPLRISGKAQSYAWGKIGANSKVAQLMDADSAFTAEGEKPYAELWMGTHPNAPSTVDVPGVGQTALKDVLSEKNLSSALFAQYGGDLPFLFKILSINKALSIQAHPDKTLAQKLFAERPDIYKDPNHKPEMAVALTPFEAFLKFRQLSEIAAHFSEYPVLAELVPAEVLTEFNGRAAFFSSEDEKEVTANRAVLKKIFDAVSHASNETVKTLVPKLIKSIEAKGTKTELDNLVLRLDKEYPTDIGIFCAFLLNYVTMNAGEAIFLAANEPHAYLFGDCVECMAASDNVVRSGLTPKYRDVETLVSMLTYNYGPADKQKLTPETNFKGLKHSIVYDPPIDEFTILLSNLKGTETEVVPGLDGPSIFIVTSGKGSLEFKDLDGSNTTHEISAGFIYFIGAGIPVTIKASGEEFVSYRAFCTKN